MRVAIKKWGNSAGMIIPAPVLEKLHFQIGQELVVEVRGNELVLKARKPKYLLTDLIRKCDFDADPVSDIDIWKESAPKGNEVW